MSTTTAYGATPDLTDCLVIAVSQSGGSPDLVASTTAARAAGAITLAVTNSADSALARSAEHHIDVLAGPERALPATKTYTAELLALYLLVEGLRGGDGVPAAAPCPPGPRPSWPARRRSGGFPPATGSPSGWSSPRAATATRPPRRRR